MSKHKISDFLENYGDGIHGTPNYDENGTVYFINGNNLVNGKIQINANTLKITEEEANKIKRDLNEKTLLLSINGTLGNIALYNHEKITLGKSACFLNVKEEKDKIFLKYVLSTKEFKKYMQLVATGSTIKNLAPSQVANYEFELKDNVDKYKVSNLLSSIDNKIENNNKINAELESLAKTIYDYWFLQFEFPNEEGKPYKSSGGKMVANEKLNRMIPDGWKNGNLYDIAEFTNGLACQKHRPIKNNQRLPVIKIREMHNGFTSETEWVRDDIPQKYVIDDGDILFSWSATLETIIWTGGQGALNQHIFKVSEKNCAKYYVFMQLAEYVKNFVAMAEARKTTMGHITSDHLNQSRVVLPCTKVIDSFEQKVTPLFTSIIKNKQESIELSKLREFLLPLLMNGQVGFIENE